MTPELQIIIELFISFCAIVFIGNYLFQKLVKGIQDIATNNPKGTSKKHEFIDMQTSPIYSYLPNNIFHQ